MPDLTSDPRYAWTLTPYDCECCDLPICQEKRPGIGYYCGDCFSHLCESEHLGRPRAGFATFDEFREWENAEHVRMRRRGHGYPHARTIPDLVFLRAVYEAQRHAARTFPGGWQSGTPGHWLPWATRWGVQAALCGYRFADTDNSFWPDLTDDDKRLVPMKVVMAKFARLRRRDLVDGCGCGCRGDYELTDGGFALLGVDPTDQTQIGAALSVLPEESEAPVATQTAEPAVVKVPGPHNCTSADPQLNVGHLIVANLSPGQGLAICGYVMNVADHPSMHVDCTCDPAMPRCEGCVAAKVAADDRKAAMSS